MNRRYEIADNIIEYGIYLYIVFMFLAKGEGIRNILIIGNFIIWLSTLNHRKNLEILKGPIFTLSLIYIVITSFSTLFSLDPAYSFREVLEGPRKFLFLLPVIATVMSDERRIKNLTYVSFITLIFIVLTAYYSYFYHDIEMLKPDTLIVHAWHNKFARYICILMPIAFIIYFFPIKRFMKTILIVGLTISIVALILSTSRTGYAGFLSIVITWALYLSIKKHYNFKKTVALFMAAFFIIGAIAYFFMPGVKSRLGAQISTLSERTIIWNEAVHAIKEKPLLGWGYGSRIFHQDEPFITMDQKTAIHKEKGPHNMFIAVLFHQGIIGLVPYLAMLVTAIVIFWRAALKMGGIGSYMLVTCASILIGNYIIHSMMASVKLHYLAVVLGLGMAATGINEDSHN